MRASRLAIGTRVAVRQLTPANVTLLPSVVCARVHCPDLAESIHVEALVHRDLRAGRHLRRNSGPKLGPRQPPSLMLGVQRS